MKTKLFASLIISSLFIIAGDAVAVKYELSLRTDRPQQPDSEGMFYTKGDNVKFTADLKADGIPTSAVVQATISYPGIIKPVTQDLDIKDGTGTIVIPAKDPGWIYASVSLPPPSGKGRALAQDSAGALVDPFLIRPGAERPKDFDAFWDSWTAKTTNEPIKIISNEKIELTEKQNPGNKIIVREFEINCVGPMPSTGFYGMPVNAKPKSLPIIAKFQWAGGGIEPELPLYYSDAAIFMTVGKFGAPYRLREEKWASLGDISGGYKHDKNIEDKNNAFLLWMILRDLRALQFAKTLPEWDGKTIVVVGESLGGAQSFILGGLDSDITFSCPCVPALSDHGGQCVLRRSGWPVIWEADSDGKPVDEKNALRAENARYFDTINFAARYKPHQEISVGTGLLDGTCPPEGVFAAYNSLPANMVRKIWVNPRAGHEAGNGHGGKRIEEIIGK